MSLTHGSSHETLDLFNKSAGLVSRSRSWGAFSQLRLESQNDKKCGTFEEALATVQIMTTLNLLNVHNYYLKSYLLCQTILATANGQIAISYYVCDLSCHRKSYVCNTIASVKHDALLIVMLLCAASLHICLFIV